METNESQINEATPAEAVNEKQEIKISKQKLNDLKKNILISFLIAFGILLINSFLLKLDISVERSSRPESGYYDSYGFSYWVTDEGYGDEFKGLFKFGSDSFESSTIVKMLDLQPSDYYEINNNNKFLKILIGNIPFIIFGNFMLLTFLAIIIYFLRREFIKFRSKYIVKIE